MYWIDAEDGTTQSHFQFNNDSKFSDSDEASDVSLQDVRSLMDRSVSRTSVLLKDPEPLSKEEAPAAETIVAAEVQPEEASEDRRKKKKKSKVSAKRAF